MAKKFLNNMNDILLLTQYVVEGRYAVFHDDLDDADKYIKIVDELLDFVRKEIT